jgi:DNA-binding PadR family transcriptional regulator
VSLSHLLLALLSDRPSSGYSLKRRIDDELAPLWTAELSQIYPTLARLQRAGFLSWRVVGPQGGPGSYRYRPTATGRSELARWLAEPPRPPVFRDESLIRLAIAATHRPHDEAAARYERTLADQIRRLRHRPGKGSLAESVRQAALPPLEAIRRWARAQSREQRPPEKRAAVRPHPSRSPKKR